MLNKIFLIWTYGCCISGAKFTWKDALNLDSMLTEEEIMVRDQFKSYCQDKLMPRILMANRNEGITTLFSLRPLVKSA